MIAIGILLVLASTGAAAMVATGGGTPAQVTFGAFHLQNTTGFFFFAGALCSAVLLIGAWTIWRGYLRWRDRGRELQELRMRAAEAVNDTAVPFTETTEPVPSSAGSSHHRDPMPDRSTLPEEDPADPFADRPLRRARRRRSPSGAEDTSSSEAGVPG